MTVIIDFAPEIFGLDIPSEMYEDVSYSLDANISDYESENEIGLCLDDDVDDGSIVIVIKSLQPNYRSLGARFDK